MRRLSSAIRALVASVFIAFTLGACAPGTRAPASATPNRASRPPASVLLISFDGFRADYLDRGLTPRLSALARDGVRAAWLTPPYPTLTFPAHYTIVTGLHPDHHGIVHNTMRDPALGAFSLNNREAVGTGAWWGGEPIWVTAERAGMPTATYFWPGSEAEILGVRPTRWKLFDTKVPIDDRVDTVLEWLGESAATRPRLATLYLEALDNASHNFSPDSAEVNKALAVLDAALGRLLDGLAARQRIDVVDVIVLADHGMAPVPPDHVVAVEDMVDPSIATVVSTGQSVGFNPVPGKEREAEARLVGAHKQYECWPKAQLPARWKYGRHPRVPAIICQMNEGWDAGTRAGLAKRPKGVTRGSHGFDPALVSMRTIFIASGPSFKRGVVLPAIESVDVYPLLTTLLGLKVPSQDGDPRALTEALR